MYLKKLEQCPAQSKCFVSITIFILQFTYFTQNYVCNDSYMLCVSLQFIHVSLMYITPVEKYNAIYLAIL